MTDGMTIDFFNKRAEELKEEEKPVSAGVSGSDTPADTESDGKIDVKIDSGDVAKSESEDTSSADPVSEDTKREDKPEEKTAASALDKAMAIASDAGRPTGTGIASGAGLGAIAAALGMLYRANSDEEDESITSNPLLLGALGAGAGYLGGNLIDRLPAKKNNTTGALGHALDLGGLAGIYHLGNILTDNANKLEYLDAAKNYSDLSKQIKPKTIKGKNGKLIDVKPGWTDIDPGLQKKILEAQKRYRESEYLIDSASTNLKNLGELPQNTKVRLGLTRGKHSPIAHINNILRSIGEGNSRTALKELSNSIVRGAGKGKGILRHVTTPRLAALAALAGLGHVGYRMATDN